MTSSPDRRWQHIGGALFIGLGFYFFITYTRLVRIGNTAYSWVPDLQFTVDHPSHHMLNSLDLDEEQCRATFPSLTKGIDDLVALGPFTLKQAIDMGPLQARLKNGEASLPTSWTGFSS